MDNREFEDEIVEIIGRIREINFNLEAQEECLKVMLENNPTTQAEIIDKLYMINNLLYEQNNILREKCYLYSKLVKYSL